MVLTVIDQVAMIDLQLRSCLHNGQYLDWETLTAFPFSKRKTN